MPLPSHPCLTHWLLILLVSVTPLAASDGPVAEKPSDSGAPPATFALSRRDHLSRLGVPRWHSGGHCGRGMKVAILDSGFSGYRAQLGRTLPAKIQVRSFRDDGNLEAKDSQHGILCAEVVHSIAPEAELLFANWEPSHPQRFIDAVRWAVQEGARVISCSIIMPTWSDGEGGGPVHAELTRVVGDGSGPGDVLFFACAGNTADRHWSGSFDGDDEGYHLWGDGNDNVLIPWGEGRVSVEMCAEKDAPLELIVRDMAAQRDVQSCRLNRGEHRTAVVRFLPKSGRSYSIRVHALNEAAGSRFHLFVLGGSLRQHRVRGSIPFPGDGKEVITVGAVEVDEERAAYSSCGPNSPRPKPDLVAIIPFASRFRPRPFAGTSAATPQAAGLAAVLWSRQTDARAGDVWKVLQKSARDLGPQGHDWETGHGLARLPVLK